MAKSQIRKDYFREIYVVVAPARAVRPHTPDTKRDELAVCHFCPENFKNETITYQDNNYDGDWEVISILNKFPALTQDNPEAYGRYEIIVETRRHNLYINGFSIDHIVRVFNAYIDRFEELSNMDQIKYVTVFKNEGVKSGNSIAHAHSQVVAVPFVPPKIAREIDSFSSYRVQNSTCPYCDIITKETDKPRVVWEDENVFVLAPYASEAPYGLWLLPKRHVRLFSDLNRQEKESIAFGLKKVLTKLYEAGIDYNYFIMNGVGQNDYHAHIELVPRPDVLGGFELGTGVKINPISPEYATRFYQGKIKIETDPNF